VAGQRVRECRAQAEGDRRRAASDPQRQLADPEQLAVPVRGCGVGGQRHTETLLKWQAVVGPELGPGWQQAAGSRVQKIIGDLRASACPPACAGLVQETFRTG
jgi:hypothetical protein